MSEPAITVPPPAVIAERIAACRRELSALLKLQRLARTAMAAEQARASRDAAGVEAVTSGQ
jgi:hypothetical protein